MPNVVTIPLPPLEAQREIVARIDALFAEVEDGEAALARARADLGTWRRALLKAAVTGKLTSDWRAANAPQESGADLLARILAEGSKPTANHNGKTRKATQTLEASEEHEALMWEAPDGWTWSQLGEFAFVTKLAGFEYTKFVKYSEGGDLRVIKAENAGPRGFRPTNYSRIYSRSVAELTRSRLIGGDLLMVFVGAGTGNVGMVPDGEEFFLGPNIGMMRIKTESVRSHYVELFLRSPGGKSLATASMKAVAQPSLSMTTIRQIPILVPPVAEQEMIILRLGNAMTAVNDTEEALLDHSAAAGALRQSILAAAFRGALTA